MSHSTAEALQNVKTYGCQKSKINLFVAYPEKATFRDAKVCAQLG